MNNQINFLSYWRAFGRRIFTFAMIATLSTLVIFPSQINSALAEGETVHTLTIKKETVDNKEGEFTYRVKAWKKEEKENNYERIAVYTNQASESDQPIFFSIEKTFMFNNTNFESNYIYFQGQYGDNVVYPENYEEDTESPAPRNLTEDEANSLIKFMNLGKELDGKIQFEGLQPIYKYNLNRKDGEADLYYWIYKTEENITVDGNSYNLYLGVEGFENDNFGLDSDGNTNLLIQKPLMEKTYLDLSSPLSNPVEENTYEFKLNQGGQKQITIPDGYNYEVTEIEQDDWALESIDNNSSLTKAEGIMTEDKEHIFLNRNTNEQDEDDQEGEEDQAGTPAASKSEDPEIPVPNTGENTSNISATRVGVVAFTIIVVITRIIYLIRRYQKNKA